MRPPILLLPGRPTIVHSRRRGFDLPKDCRKRCVKTPRAPKGEHHSIVDVVTRPQPRWNLGNGRFGANPVDPSRVRERLSCADSSRSRGRHPAAGVDRAPRPKSLKKEIDR